MDIYNGFFPCPKCGQGPGSFPVIKPPIFKPPMTGGSSYCSKCGAELRTTCTACNGTGERSSPRIYGLSKDRYCTACGRSLPEPDETCGSCKGTGQVNDSNHTMFCPRRF